MASSRRSPRLYFASALLVASTIGCSDRLATYPVAGKVEFTTGGAVHVGTIELKSREHGVQARGPIQPDGSFVLTTYQDGDGAVAGMHDCVLVQFVMTEDIAGHRSSTIGVVDPRYASYATSGLTIEVSATEPNKPIVAVDGLRKKQPENHSHPK